MLCSFQKNVLFVRINHINLYSAVIVSIFGFAVGFGFLKEKLRFKVGCGFMVQDGSYAQSKL